MATTIDLSLTGCVNGAPVSLTGQATLERGTVEIDVTTRVLPLHCDPVLEVLRFMLRKHLPNGSALPEKPAILLRSCHIVSRPAGAHRR